MDKINFEAGTQVSPAKVTIDNVDHNVTPAVWEGNTPLSPFVLNTMQDNIEEDINSTKSHKYHLIITADIDAGANVTLPCYYAVGQNVLDVYVDGERLLLSSDDAGTDGHYREVGEGISNIIKTTTDWALEVGDYLDLVVRGDYSAT